MADVVATDAGDLNGIAPSKAPPVRGACEFESLGQCSDVHLHGSTSAISLGGGNGPPFRTLMWAD